MASLTQESFSPGDYKHLEKVGPYLINPQLVLDKSVAALS